MHPFTYMVDQRVQERDEQEEYEETLCKILCQISYRNERQR